MNLPVGNLKSGPSSAYMYSATADFQLHRQLPTRQDYQATRQSMAASNMVQKQGNRETDKLLEAEPTGHHTADLPETRAAVPEVSLLVSYRSRIKRAPLTLSGTQSMGGNDPCPADINTSISCTLCMAAYS